MNTKVKVFNKYLQAELKKKTTSKGIIMTKLA